MLIQNVAYGNCILLNCYSHAGSITLVEYLPNVQLSLTPSTLKKNEYALQIHVQLCELMPKVTVFQIFLEKKQFTGFLQDMNFQAENNLLPT